MKKTGLTFLTAISTVILTALTAISSVAHAADDPARPGYLTDYKYQVANFKTMADVQALMSTELNKFFSDSVCADRAEVWAYVMAKHNYNIGKVFIHFTAESQVGQGTDWAYHVAPYVLVAGQEVVLDIAFPAFRRQPAPIDDWTKYFGKSDECVVLDPVHNPKHMALEQNDLPSDDVDPNSFHGGNPRQYPRDEALCYIRKVPGFYQYPYQVYGADLALAGKVDFADWMRDSYNEKDVIKACDRSVLPYRYFPEDCKDYLRDN